MQLQSITTTARYTSDVVPTAVPDGETSNAVEVTVTDHNAYTYVFLRRPDGSYFRYSGPLDWVVGE